MLHFFRPVLIFFMTFCYKTLITCTTEMLYEGVFLIMDTFGHVYIENKLLKTL